jgi:hypothetical protein
MIEYELSKNSLVSCFAQRISDFRNRKFGSVGVPCPCKKKRKGMKIILFLYSFLLWGKSAWCFRPSFHNSKVSSSLKFVRITSRAKEASVLAKSKVTLSKPALFSSVTSSGNELQLHKSSIQCFVEDYIVPLLSFITRPVKKIIDAFVKPVLLLDISMKLNGSEPLIDQRLVEPVFLSSPSFKQPCVEDSLRKEKHDLTYDNFLPITFDKMLDPSEREKNKVTQEAQPAMKTTQEKKPEIKRSSSIADTLIMGRRYVEDILKGIKEERAKKESLKQGIASSPSISLEVPVELSSSVEALTDQSSEVSYLHFAKNAKVYLKTVESVPTSMFENKK